MSPLLLIGLGLLAAIGVIATVLLIQRRRRVVQTELLLRHLAQARIRAQVEWTLRAMLRAAGEAQTRRRGDDPHGREVTRR